MATTLVDKIAGGGGAASIPLSLTTTTAATTTEGILLGTSASATSGAQKFSPALHFKGSSWKTGGTPGAESVDWNVELQAVQGASSGIGELHFLSSVNGGAYADAGYFARAISMTFGQDGLVADTLHASNGIITAGTVTQTSFMIEYAVQSVVLCNSAGTFGWSSIAGSTDPSSLRTAKDTGLSRISAALGAVGNGTAGDFSGALKMNRLITAPLTFATLPASPSQGARCLITDATSTVFATLAATGGANVMPVFYDGTNWRIG